MFKKLIYIEWEDAMDWNDRWRDEEEVLQWAQNDAWIVKQSGWLMKENKNYIVLASKYSLQDNAETLYSNFSKIPKTWIRKRIDLTKHLKNV